MLEGAPAIDLAGTMPPSWFRRYLAEFGNSGFVSQVDVVRATLAADDSGGQTAGTPYIASYLCKVIAITGMRRAGESIDTAGLISSDALYYAYFPRAANLRGSDRLFFPGYLPKWQAGHAYSPGGLIVPASKDGNGRYWKNLKGGTSGTIQPVWDTRLHAITSDGPALWQCAGVAFVLEITTIDDKKSSATNIAVLCKEAR